MASLKRDGIGPPHSDYAQKALRMTRRILTNLLTILSILAVVIGTVWAVRRYHKPGQLDVMTAQAMDMSAMRPPTGAAPVVLASVRRGSLESAVVYSATVRAYNEQEISPRITGTLLSLSVYPGDRVRAGQVVATLDTAEVGAKASQADALASQARIGANVAQLTHHLHHQAALDQADAQVGAAQQAVETARAEAQAAQDAVADVRAGVITAQANADYWKTEIAREQQLAEAGAVSRQEYQNELAQAQSAAAALTQAVSKVRQTQASVHTSQSRIIQAQREVSAAEAARRMAQADLVVAAGQAEEAAAGAVSASAAAREASFVVGYSRILSPADGIVTERLTSPGTLVQPGTVLLKIAEISRVRVQAHIAVADLAGVEPGTAIQVIPQGSEAKPIATRVSAVFPSASDQTRTAIVEAVIPNPGGHLRPGAFATMRLIKPGVSNRTLVPAGAVLSEEGGGSAVWLASGGVVTSAPTTYRCEKCHMTYSAAAARKNNYLDPMDGGRLLPVVSAASQSAGAVTAHRISVQAGASDGDWTEVAGDVPYGSRVVTRGQAGLTEGAALVATAWGADGPLTLPTASASASGKTLYKCEKCGMTYSEADAKKNNFVDPMDGGKLVLVKGQG